MKDSLSENKEYSQGAYAGRAFAYVTDVMKAEQMYPTILECLVFWLMSAMGIEGGWEVPEVSEEPQLVETPCLVGDLLPPDSFEYGRDRAILLAISGLF